ncbi:MAG: NAD+ synthase [Lautropia sp.]
MNATRISITCAQINPTIGDIGGNVALMTAAARRAQARQAAVARADRAPALIVFPEMSLTAYYPADLLDDPAFRDRIAHGLDALKAASRETPDLHWVVGAPLPTQGRAGKRFHNALLVLHAGEVLLDYAKQLLPTYNVFNEHRHFEPGPDVARVLQLGAVTIGFMICEDGWNDDGRDYAVNPFEHLAAAKPDLVVSINASPSSVGKREERHLVFGKACARHRLPLVYVNQVGGHDSLVYDGASFALDASGELVFEARRFVEDEPVLRFDAADGCFGAADGGSLPAVTREGLSTMAFYRRQIVLGLTDYARRCGFRKVVVGSSGGIDSALTLALAVEAFGPDHVSAITMPSVYSSAGSVDDSAQLCRNLGIRLDTCAIRDLVTTFRSSFRESTIGEDLRGLALENLQARIRGTLLMAYSNMYGHLLLTTGNKSELSVGYCTLYGDTNGGLGLIGDLYKTEVFALSRHLNEAAGRELIPRAIIEKPPSAELAPDQKDTDSLPPYEVLDDILKALVEGERLARHEWIEADARMRALRATEDGTALIRKIERMVARAEYKRRQAPPILRVRGRAFGSGRQLPIAAAWP